MFLWRPSENAAFYADHHEIATDAQDEEYGLPQEKLVVWIALREGYV